MNYEQVIARSVLQALQTAKLKADDVELLKASFMSKPDPDITPSDTLRVDTFAAIHKLRDAIAGDESEDALSKLLSAAETAAKGWLDARS